MDASIRTENRPYSVLLVDDEPGWLEVVKAGLADAHLTLDCALTGHEALRAVGKNTYDLVILDLGLPDVDGLDLVRQLKLNLSSPHTPIVVLTASTEASYKLRGFDLGITDYVTKPIELSELRARIHAILRGKKRLDVLLDLNRKLEGAREGAEATARARAEFLANMSHEIRTPMNGVIAMTELMLQTPLNAEQRDCLDTIKSSGETLLEIINDILNLSKIESGKLELEHKSFNLQQMVEEAVDLLAAQAVRKRIDLNYLVEDSGLPTLRGDALRLRQVLTNLVSNAIKFTEKGEVSVEVKMSSVPESEGRWELHFQVRDTGTGIPKEKLGLLFQSFTQIDTSISRRFGGTGLGLAISKGLVELMGGEIWAESVEGEGSIFHFTITLEEGEPALAPARPAPGTLIGKRVLIVDDNETNRRILTLLTNRWGMHPTAASRPREAIALLNTAQPFDLAIFDMLMPEMDGVHLAQEVRKMPARRGVPIVLLTSIGPRDELMGQVDKLFNGSLTKPVKPGQLEDVLVSVLNNSSTVTIVRQQPPPAPPPSMDTQLARRYPFKILVADDNPINLKVASRLLAQMGYQVDVAINGEEAIQILAQATHDLVFMDLQMPKMDGLEATKRIRLKQSTEPKDPQFARRIIIIAMTANAMPGDREKCLNAGMDDYIPKPVQPQKIQGLIEFYGLHVFSGQSAQPLPSAQPSQPAAALVPVAPAIAAPAPLISAPTPPAPPPVALFEEPPLPVPVDMTRLLDFSAGDPQQLDELVTVYTTQTTENLVKIEQALTAREAGEALRLAHSSAGASATCGMTAMAVPFRKIEQLMGSNKFLESMALLRTLDREFERTKKFLQEQRSKMAA